MNYGSRSRVVYSTEVQQPCQRRPVGSDPRWHLTGALTLYNCDAGTRSITGTANDVILVPIA